MEPCIRNRFDLYRHYFWADRSGSSRTLYSVRVHLKCPYHFGLGALGNFGDRHSMAVCAAVTGKTAVTHPLPHRKCAASWASLCAVIPGQLTGLGVWPAYNSGCRRD